MRGTGSEGEGRGRGRGIREGGEEKGGRGSWEGRRREEEGRRRGRRRGGEAPCSTVDMGMCCVRAVAETNWIWL